MSVWVMTSPLTMAVALTTEGMAEPNTVGLLGSFSALVLSGWASAESSCWAIAVEAVASAIAAVTNHTRVEVG